MLTSHKNPYLLSSITFSRATSLSSLFSLSWLSEISVTSEECRLRRWTIGWPFLFFGTLSAVWSDPVTPSSSQPENSYWQRSDSTKVEGENHPTQKLLTTVLCLKLGSFHMITTESGNFGCSLAESGLLLCSGHFSWSLRHPHAYLSPEIPQLVMTFPSPCEVCFHFCASKKCGNTYLRLIGFILQEKMIKWFCLWEWYICFLVCFLCEQNYVWFKGRSFSCYRCCMLVFPENILASITPLAPSITDLSHYWHIPSWTTLSLTYPVPDLPHIWLIPLSNHRHILSLTHLITDPPQH